MIDKEVTLELDEKDIAKFKADAAWTAKCQLHECYLKELFKSIETINKSLLYISYDITKHLETKSKILANGKNKHLTDFYNTDNHIVNMFAIMLCDDPIFKYGLKFYKYGNIYYLETSLK